MSYNHGPLVEEGATYEALSEDGAPQGKASPVLHAQAKTRQSPPMMGFSAHAYEEWTDDELIERAGELGISDRWTMTKDALIDALRRH